MKFGLNQKKRFGSINGAYSEVTIRENYDSQITLTDYEADIVVSYFGKERIHIGNVQSNEALSSKQFFLYPKGNPINLNVVYPKPEKTELRLYISSRAGFKPDSGDIWFVFVRDDNIWIGAMSESEWRRESAELKEDETDNIYQSVVNNTNEIRIAKLKERDSYIRDRKIALQRMEMSGFACEFDPNHHLFISRFTNNPYLEAHHLVPIGLQDEFKKPLDTINNVFCLCPFCHRAVHHAEIPLARKILDSLSSKHEVLKEYNIDLSELFGFYAVEDIIK